MQNGIAIIKVCYYDNTKRDSIKCVKAARFSSNDLKTIESMGSIVSWSKGQIIQMLNDSSQKSKIFTAIVEDDKYLLGPEVAAYPENNPQYVTINKNDVKRDDLDNLPLYEAHC